MKCLVCHGSKINTCTITKFGTDEVKTMKMDCIWCDGTGEMTNEDKESYEYQLNMWCKCGNPSKGSEYYDDGEHHEITKHHYRCKDCGKVLQIG